VQRVTTAFITSLEQTTLYYITCTKLISNNRYGIVAYIIHMCNIMQWRRLLHMPLLYIPATGVKPTTSAPSQSTTLPGNSTSTSPSTGTSSISPGPSKISTVALGLHRIISVYIITWLTSVNCSSTANFHPVKWYCIMRTMMWLPVVFSSYMFFCNNYGVKPTSSKNGMMHTFVASVAAYL